MIKTYIINDTLDGCPRNACKLRRVEDLRNEICPSYQDLPRFSVDMMHHPSALALVRQASCHHIWPGALGLEGA